MSLRFKVLSALYLVIVLLASSSEMRVFGGVMDVFAGLGALLILCIIALWPNASRADRVDRSVDGGSWADRIDVEKMGREQNRAD